MHISGQNSISISLALSHKNKIEKLPLRTSFQCSDRYYNTDWQFEMFKRDKDNGHDSGFTLSVNLNLVSLFPVTYVVGTHWNRLIAAIPMFIYSICFSDNLVFRHKLFLTNSQILSLLH